MSVTVNEVLAPLARATPEVRAEVRRHLHGQAHGYRGRLAAGVGQVQRRPPLVPSMYRGRTGDTPPRVKSKSFYRNTV
jgi:hypothetical protein